MSSERISQLGFLVKRIAKIKKGLLHRIQHHYLSVMERAEQKYLSRNGQADQWSRLTGLCFESKKSGNKRWWNKKLWNGWRIEREVLELSKNFNFSSTLLCQFCVCIRIFFLHQLSATEMQSNHFQPPREIEHTSVERYNWKPVFYQLYSIKKLMANYVHLEMLNLYNQTISFLIFIQHLFLASNGVKLSFSISFLSIGCPFILFSCCTC